MVLVLFNQSFFETRRYIQQLCFVVLYFFLSLILKGLGDFMFKNPLQTQITLKIVDVSPLFQ